jgi:hypothetical protein
MSQRQQLSIVRPAQLKARQLTVGNDPNKGITGFPCNLRAQEMGLHGQSHQQLATQYDPVKRESQMTSEREKQLKMRRVGLRQRLQHEAEARHSLSERVQHPPPSLDTFIGLRTTLMKRGAEKQLSKDDDPDDEVEVRRVISSTYPPGLLD